MLELAAAAISEMSQQQFAHGLDNGTSRTACRPALEAAQDAFGGLAGPSDARSRGGGRGRGPVPIRFEVSDGSILVGCKPL